MQSTAYVTLGSTRRRPRTRRGSSTDAGCGCCIRTCTAATIRSCSSRRSGPPGSCPPPGETVPGQWSSTPASRLVDGRRAAGHPAAWSRRRRAAAAAAAPPARHRRMLGVWRRADTARPAADGTAGTRRHSRMSAAAVAVASMRSGMRRRPPSPSVGCRRPGRYGRCVRWPATCGRGGGSASSATCSRRCARSVTTVVAPAEMVRPVLRRPVPAVLAAIVAAIVLAVVIWGGVALAGSGADPDSGRSLGARPTASADKPPASSQRRRAAPHPIAGITSQRPARMLQHCRLARSLRVTVAGPAADLLLVSPRPARPLHALRFYLVRDADHAVPGQARSNRCRDTSPSGSATTAARAAPGRHRACLRRSADLGQ